MPCESCARLTAEVERLRDAACEPCPHIERAEQAEAELSKQRGLLAESTAALAAAHAEHIEIEGNLQELIAAANERAEEAQDVGARLMLDSMSKAVESGGMFSDPRANVFVLAVKQSEAAREALRPAAPPEAHD